MKNKGIKENKPSAKKNLVDPKTIKKITIALAIFISLFAYVLYAQSLNHNYTLDDHPVLDENTVTTKGLEGIPTILTTDYWYGSGHNELRGPVYRPTSMIIFAIAWEFFQSNPKVYHFISVLFYAVTCLVLFLVLCKIFQKQNLVFPFICALFYTAHPIHTEVVNNIKSLDEILCFLFGIISIWYFLRYHTTRSILSLALGGISFFLSLSSKETGISFLVIIPLIFYFFYDNIKKSIITISALLVALTAIWLLLRSLVFNALPLNNETTQSVINNTLNAAPNFISRYATAFYILLRYVALLIFPHPLSCDYNFAQIKIQSLNDPGALLGVIFYLALGIFVIFNFKNKNIVAFAILVYLLSLAPVSNIFFLGGSSMAERFMYTPSLGFSIAITHFLIKFTKTESTQSKYNNLINFFSANSKLFLLVFGIIFLYSIKVFSRNKDWKDNITIFTKDVQVSKNSATANQILGSALLFSAQKLPNSTTRTDTFNLAKKYLKRSIEIYSNYYAPLSHLGVIYLFQENLDSANYYLRQGWEKAPNDVDVNFNYGIVLIRLKKYDEAIKVLKHLIVLKPGYENAYYNLAVSYQNKGDLENALANYFKVIEINPGNPNAYYNAAGILKTKGDSQKGDEFMNKAISLGYK